MLRRRPIAMKLDVGKGMAAYEGWGRIDRVIRQGLQFFESNSLSAGKRQLPFPPTVFFAQTLAALFHTVITRAGIISHTNPVSLSSAASLLNECAPQVRRAAETLDEKNRTDHVLHTPDNLTCYLHFTANG
ncbi:MAG: hypothetical protein HP491_03375 [Nitrospira sp.]|nr:hypothetical protein [Nitrospira sp.]